MFHTTLVLHFHLATLFDLTLALILLSMKPILMCYLFRYLGRVLAAGLSLVDFAAATSSVVVADKAKMTILTFSMALADLCSFKIFF